MMGVIIMDTKWFAIGLACREGDPIVDMTITHTRQQAASLAVEWFEKKIWTRCGQDKHVLKEISPEIPESEHVHLPQALEKLEKQYYPESLKAITTQHTDAAQQSVLRT